MSQHDWTEIFNGLNNQNCLFCKTTFFQKLSQIWCSLKTLKKKKKSTLLTPSLFKKHVNGSKDNTVNKNNMGFVWAYFTMPQNF